MTDPLGLGPIHHVGYVVADLDAGLAALGRTVPVEVAVREVMESQGVEALMAVTGGGGAIELITPLDPEGAIARFLASRGEGFHHVAFAVPDVDTTLDALRGRGVEVVDERARRGLGGHMVGFLHPRSTLGVLTELVQADHGAAG